MMSDKMSDNEAKQILEQQKRLAMCDGEFCKACAFRDSIYAIDHLASIRRALGDTGGTMDVVARARELREAAMMIGRWHGHDFAIPYIEFSKVYGMPADNINTLYAALDRLHKAVFSSPELAAAALNKAEVKP
jgi:hypothetical protein